MKNEMNSTRFDRILVVDDTTANLRLLTNLLTEHDYTVYPASDGELALEFVQSTLPDLILLDIRLPGIDGFEVCRRLKADERTRSIPIIFISVLESESDKVRGFQAGAVDYITKPFQAEEVLARVRSHLHLRELTEHLEQKVAERTEELHAANAQLQRELAERKLAEEKRQEFEERLRLTLEATQIGIFDWDVERDIWLASPEYYTMLGYEPKEAIGDRKEWLERVHPDDRARVETKIREVIVRDPSADQPQAYEYEARIRHADGTYRWEHVKGFGVKRDQQGRVARMLGIRMDITERKAAEEALRQLNIELDRRVLDRTAQLEAANLFMPQGNGFELLHHLRATAPELPVIVVSGQGDRDDVIEALRLGAWDYLYKPIENASFLRLAINRVLEKAQLLSENRAYRDHLECLVAQKSADLLDQQKILMDKTVGLEKANEALKSLLDQREIEKNAIEQTMVGNLKRFVFPYLDELEGRSLS
jgi:PAS domain S-box-containing protein